MAQADFTIKEPRNVKAYQSLVARLGRAFEQAEREQRHGGFLVEPCFQAGICQSADVTEREKLKF